ncbi:MAG: DUF1127 domain-containing protein [Pseudomonadota bacterium]
MTFFTDHATRTLPRRATQSRFGQFLHLLTVARTRQALGSLDADALEDIGLTREQAQSEANRSFWDVPAHWRC